LIIGGCIHKEKNDRQTENNNHIDTAMKDGKAIYFNGTQEVYKDFDLFSFKVIPFKANDPVLYPFIKVDSSHDTVNVIIFYKPETIKDVTFIRTKDLWEVKKPSTDRAYGGGRNTVDRIIVLRDVAVLEMKYFYDWEKKDGFSPEIGSYSRFTKSVNCIKEENYNVIDISEKNLRNLYFWDSASYKKSSFHPSYKLNICIDNEKAVSSGVEISGNTPGLVENYNNTVIHNNNSNSFFYYLFKWW
jgi:hypothetical protein